ncbi:MAG: endolytic transglycosylase MltG, partial [Alphaproteobacteria bacterium]|nr:endolytic transglycosylase MltG [Alphaproteobacteria bacterium]
LHWFDAAIGAAGPLPEKKLVYIAPGTPTAALAQQLRQAGVIGNPFVFRLEAQLQSRLRPLKAGEYMVPAHISILDLVTVLQSGKTFERKITIPEGLTSPEIVQLLDKETALKGDVAAVPPEGSLLPNTYEFSYGDTRESLLARMQKAMKAELAALWTKRAAKYPLTEQQAVVLASVVEKETGVAPERGRIAGVFFNRLKRGIPLQSDPTVIFALTQGQQPLGRPLTADDLKTPSPYNTYVTAGLPPAAICNPGVAALKAALDPEKNDYLYFVANGQGGSSFSKTLQQHKRDIAAWLRARRAEKK